MQKQISEVGPLLKDETSDPEAPQYKTGPNKAEGSGFTGLK